MCAAHEGACGVDGAPAVVVEHHAPPAAVHVGAVVLARAPKETGTHLHGELRQVLGDGARLHRAQREPDSTTAVTARRATEIGRPPPRYGFGESIHAPDDAAVLLEIGVDHTPG